MSIIKYLLVFLFKLLLFFFGIVTIFILAIATFIAFLLIKKSRYYKDNAVKFSSNSTATKKPATHSASEIKENKGNIYNSKSKNNAPLKTVTRRLETKDAEYNDKS